jgi:predicted phosphodiesterase
MKFELGEAIAVIADVHGNRWALEAVLDDIERRGIDHLLNLGDSLYGPLDPAGTARLLRELDPVSVRGNQDRTLLEHDPSAVSSPTYCFVVEQLSPDDLRWLSRHSVASLGVGPLCLCHGTPESDNHYLLERVTQRGVELTPLEVLGRELADITGDVVLCAHSHVPRLVGLPDGRCVVNPGSVGLQAYTSEQPAPHAMEAGSPHARYAVLQEQPGGWVVEHVAVCYDWDAAATAAEVNGRADWAAWLRTGRASVGPSRGR